MYYKTIEFNNNFLKKYYESPKLLGKHNMCELNHLINNNYQKDAKLHLEKIKTNKDKINYINPHFTPKCNCDIMLELLTMQTKKIVESENKYKLWLFIVYIFLTIINN
jgi:hypothetical protein